MSICCLRWADAVSKYHILIPRSHHQVGFLAETYPFWGIYTKNRKSYYFHRYSSNEILCLKPRASGVIFHGTDVLMSQHKDYGEDIGLVNLDPVASGGIGLRYRIPEYTKITGPTAGREKTG